MYIVLAIVALVFISSVIMSGPVTSTSEITYSEFLQKLEHKEFKTIEKADEFLIAVPKVQPKQETKSEEVSQNPYAVEKKAPQVQYKVLTPNDPNLMQKLENADGADFALEMAPHPLTIKTMTQWYIGLLAIVAAIQWAILLLVRHRKEGNDKMDEI